MHYSLGGGQPWHPNADGERYEVLITGLAIRRGASLEQQQRQREGPTNPCSVARAVIDASRPRASCRSAGRLAPSPGDELAIEQAHAADQEIDQEDRDRGVDEALPELFVVADLLTCRIEDGAGRGIERASRRRRA